MTALMRLKRIEFPVSCFFSLFFPKFYICGCVKDLSVRKEIRDVRKCKILFMFSVQGPPAEGGIYTVMITNNRKGNVTNMVRILSTRVKLSFWNTSVGLFSMVFLSSFFSIFTCILVRKLKNNIKKSTGR